LKSSIKIFACIIVVPLYAGAMDVGRAKSLIVSERMTLNRSHSSVSCSNEEKAHIQACVGTGCLLSVPVCGIPAAITSLCCLLDATKRFEQEEGSHHQVDLENNG
jgi:hypothetical protein